MCLNLKCPPEGVRYKNVPFFVLTYAKKGDTQRSATRVLPTLRAEEDWTVRVLEFAQ
jgi:hypothetical protein